MNNNRILVFGSNGMLGRMVSIYLSSNKDFDITITARNTSQFIEDNFSGNYLKFDVVNDNLDKVIKKQDQYSYIINCIGMIKPKIDEKYNTSIHNTVLINSYFPLDLQRIALEKNIKYIQIGTDCVFSGESGEYSENSFMDANDLYGKSKIVGEIESNNKHILRSSIIGPEVGNGYSLMNWFLKNNETEVSGFQNHEWNGVTTLNFSRVIEGIIKHDKFKFKTQHLIPKNTISKAMLLEELKKNFKKDIRIEHIDSENVINRTLVTNNNELNENLWKLSGYSKVPTIEENIEELANSEFLHRIIN